MDATRTQREPRLALYVAVWAGLLLIVAAEVGLTYVHLPVGTRLAGLLALACVEAGLGLLYFMHLRFERAILFWSLVPTLLFVLLLLDHLWPDALRLQHLRPPTP